MPQREKHRSRSIGRTRRSHFWWLQRGMFGAQRWRFECRCGAVGTERRLRASALADGTAHSTPLNRRNSRPESSAA